MKPTPITDNAWAAQAVKLMLIRAVAGISPNLLLQLKEVR